MELGRPPEDREIADRLQMPLDEYHRMTEEVARVPALVWVGQNDPDDLADRSESLADAYADKELRARLAKAILELPERSQTVLALYYQEECTQAEIAEILGVTESRVCQLLGEISVRLRARLEGETKPRTKHKER
jgi:RNA polymerase sigma factor for flagellar operon FliA